MGFHLTVHNFRGLRYIDWSPEGVCALVGPNGSGKSTLLDVPALLRDAIERGLARAFEEHGGIANSRNVYAPDNKEFGFQIGLRDIYWRMLPVETASGFRPLETMAEEGEQFLIRDLGADAALIRNRLTPLHNKLAFKVLLDESDHGLPAESWRATVTALGGLLKRYRLYEHYDLRALRRIGSSDSSERRLSRDGSNIFSLLRNWRDKRDDLYRYQFVLDGLREMFGDFFEDLEFSKAAQVVGAELRLRGGNLISASLAPDGWYVALLHLSAVASTDQGDVIAIDEPENALHPHAIKLLLGLMRDWSQRHSTTILLATHSPVILDAFKEQPQRLYVMEPTARIQPVALSELKDPSWLAHFSFGDLYAREEFGAPVDDDSDRPDHDG